MQRSPLVAATRLPDGTKEFGELRTDSYTSRPRAGAGITLLREGTIFAGRYRVLATLALGGMGAIYEVEHVETERHLAMKVMLPHILGSERLRERFKVEAKVSARIRSERLVDVIDAGVDEATEMPFIVMELLEGEDLGAHVARARRLPPADVVEYLCQAAAGLDRMHAASIIHRDLKPENLFLVKREDGSRQVKILDFGIAKVLDENTPAGTQAQGTPLYMAPEQFVAGAAVSPATDVFALGMIAYRLLTGEPYWSPELGGQMNIFVLARLAEMGPQDPASARAASRGVTLPSAFDGWFARAVAPDPADRFPSASAAVNALGEALGAPVRTQVVIRASDPFGHDSKDAIPASCAFRPTIPSVDLVSVSEHRMVETMPATVEPEGQEAPPPRPRMRARVLAFAGAAAAAATLALLSVVGPGATASAGSTAVVTAVAAAPSSLEAEAPSAAPAAAARPGVGSPPAPMAAALADAQPALVGGASANANATANTNASANATMNVNAGAQQGMTSSHAGVAGVDRVNSVAGTPRAAALPGNTSERTPIAPTRRRRYTRD